MSTTPPSPLPTPSPANKPRPPAPQFRSKSSRELKNRIFTGICMCSAGLSVAVLAVLLFTIAYEGFHYLDLGFLTASPSRSPDKSGMGPAMMGSVWICAICAFTALPLGIGTAIFLEEYKPKNPIVKRLHGLIQLNIANLAGVPSIVYGLLGLTVFVQMFGLLGNENKPSFEIGVRYADQYVDESGAYLHVNVGGHSSPETALRDGMTMLDVDDEPVTVRLVDPETWDFPDPETVEKGTLRSDAYATRDGKKSWYYFRIPFGRGVLAGGLTLMLVVLPIVIVASQEALRAVPSSLRQGALATGATKWQMISKMTLPAAIPGIMTGAILAISRAIGEAAPILILAGIVFIRFTPQHLMDDFTAMPLQIFNWANRPQEEFHQLAATGIIVLLGVLLSFNAVAVFIRQKFQKPLQ